MTENPRSILVPVDFGAASARAVAVAGAVADRCGATLRLLHAETFEAPPYFTSEQIQALETEERISRTRAEQFLTRFGRQQTTRVFSAVVVDDRPPVDAILREAAASDLVVMGTHGRHGPSRWWLGSVAERVLRDIAHPLLIVRAEATPSAPEEVFRRVLVHASAPLVGSGAVDYARHFAGCFGGDIVDGRYGLIEPALKRHHATLLAVAMPSPRTSRWLSDFGEPLVQHFTTPILFIPEPRQGERA